MTINLAEPLRRLRTARGITQETLAEFLGVSSQAVSKWERGVSQT
ncbi:MAG: helix-turn-helix transcriptional regulator [Thermoguttaceae bacterium]|nr:helix-turn-helix transcriptional regulator [Thermoguttaceae bacterium]